MKHVALALGLLLALAGCRDSTRSSPARPHVVVFLSDALRAANLPMYGYRRDTAPNLRQLASEGILFENHLAHFPGTTLSVSQLLTGRWSAPMLIGQDYLSVPLREPPANLMLLPRVLQEHGYRTALVSSHFWFKHSPRLLAAFSETHLVEDPDGRKGYAEFDKLFPVIVDFLDDAEDDGEPFFLYVHSMDTHGPNDFHPGFERLRGTQAASPDVDRYDAEIDFTDHWIGRVVDELRRRGLLESTILLVTSDHGEDFGEMGPERFQHHHGLFVRRSQMHVPLLLRLPGATHAGLRHAGMTGHVDVAPTLLRLAVPDAELSHDAVDGVDLAYAWRGDVASPPAPRLQLGRSGRYWGIFEASHELHYDTWERAFSPLLRVEPDGDNYPRLRPMEDPATEARLRQALTERRAREETRHAALPWVDAAQLPPRVELPVPFEVAPHNATAPTFVDLADDDRWTLSGTYLRAAPGESPPQLHLSTEWLPGAYRVMLRFDGSGIRGYQQRLVIEFPGAQPDTPIVVDGPESAGGRLRDLGVLRLRNPLEIRVSNPQGGVSIAGLELVREADGAAAPVDPAQKERLRQLGYE